jgi:hypothetical protein
MSFSCFLERLGLALDGSTEPSSRACPEQSRRAQAEGLAEVYGPTRASINDLLRPAMSRPLNSLRLLYNSQPLVVGMAGVKSSYGIVARDTVFGHQHRDRGFRVFKEEAVMAYT